MDLIINYVTDQNGEPKAVQIAYEDWQRIEKLLESYKAFELLKSDLTDAFNEVKHLKKDKNLRISLNDFLTEC